MEYERFVKITVVRDTNKATDQSVYDNATDACRALLAMLTQDERCILLDDYCMYCGSDVVPCNCQNDV